MENKMEYTFTREELERFAKRPVSDREWEVMASEIENLIDFYVYSDLNSLWDDIDNLIAEDDKYND
jgi:hypothetical protein